MDKEQKIPEGRLVNFYSEATKRAICEEYLGSSISKQGIQNKYGIRSKSAVVKWMRTFGYEDPRPGSNGIIPKSKPPLFSMAQSTQTDILALEAKIKALEKQLAEAELKAIVYDTLIDVAERDLKISIRKKQPTKQSTK